MGICTSCGMGTMEPKAFSSPFLIIKESVTKNEIDSGIMFVMSGKNKWGHEEHTTSYYLNKEMGMVGLQLNTMNLSSLYMHLPSRSKKNKEAKEQFQGCMDYSIQQVVKLAEGKKVVMLMGAELIRTFTGYPASEVYGLICKSDLLPNVPVIVPAPNPDKLMAVPIGELRNSLKIFAEQIQIYKEYAKV